MRVSKSASAIYRPTRNRNRAGLQVQTPISECEQRRLPLGSTLAPVHSITDLLPPVSSLGCGERNHCSTVYFFRPPCWQRSEQHSDPQSYPYFNSPRVYVNTGTTTFLLLFKRDQSFIWMNWMFDIHLQEMDTTLQPEDLRQVEVVTS